ncbi:MAG: STAS domain-containing protein [Betaproteobacteria bacterium]|nr:STAS domain-containing protein [Betaproteobacteria bacterium]
MRNAMSKTRRTLLEQTKLQIGRMSSLIEARARDVFGANQIMSADEISDFSVEFLELMVALFKTDNPLDHQTAEFKALQGFFSNVAKQILLRGGRMADFLRYAQFLQKIFIEALEGDESVDGDGVRAILLLLSNVFNELSLVVFESYLEEKERTIYAQQEELRETATPITEIWDGVLTLPIIGTLDSSRTMLIMEALLNRIASDRARAVVMDVTGVRAIDSQVSHHLIQMVRAVQLMGTDAILTGIRPEIARALTNLNIDLGNVTTRASLSDGLKEAFRRMEIHVSTPH